MVNGLEMERKRKGTKARDKGPQFIAISGLGRRQARKTDVQHLVRQTTGRVDLGRQFKFPGKIAITRQIL